MTDGMIERVKAAIERAAHVVNDYGIPLLENPEEVARAAIAAMREPTQVMQNAAVDASHEAGFIMNESETNEIWQGMIDAALSEKP